MVEDQFGEEDEGDFRWSDITKPWNIGMIIVILIWFASWWYPAKPEELIQLNGLTIGMTFIIFGMMTWKGTVAIMKYNSPQLVTQTVHGSTGGDPIIEAGIWKVYLLGTIRWGIELPGSEGTLITVGTNVDKNTGKNISIPCWVEEVEPELIPWDVAPLILKNKHCKAPYYVAWYSPTVEHLIPEAGYMREQVKKYSDQLRMVNEMLHDQRFRTLKQFEGFMDEVTKRQREDNIQNKSIQDRLFG